MKTTAVPVCTVTALAGVAGIAALPSVAEFTSTPMAWLGSGGSGGATHQEEAMTTEERLAYFNAFADILEGIAANVSAASQDYRLMAQEYTRAIAPPDDRQLVLVAFPPMRRAG